MTIIVNQEIERVSINDTTIPEVVNFVLTSGYTRTPQTLSAVRIKQNDRYSTIDITFPTDFKDNHFNGIYYYNIEFNGVEYERGYVKIITQPGGSNGSVPFISNPETENRESKQYIRPQY